MFPGDRLTSRRGVIVSYDPIVCTSEPLPDSTQEEIGIRQLLEESSLFEQSPDGLLDALESISSVQSLEKNEMIYEAGDKGERFFMVRSGQVELTRIMKSDEEAKRHVKTGETFGLLSAVTESMRRAGARAVTGKEEIICINFVELFEQIDDRSDLRSLVDAILWTLKERIDHSMDALDTLL